eukprot:4744256-Amphidinium_carterae.1
MPFQVQGVRVEDAHDYSIDKRCELALHCRLREQSAIQRLVQLLPGEPPVAAGAEVATWNLEKAFVMPMVKARKHLLDALKEQKSNEDDEQHGEDIFATIRLHTKHLNHLDAFWFLDVALLQALASTDQCSAILSAWFNGVMEKSSVCDAIAESNRIRNSPSSSWAKVGTKSELQQAHEFLENLHASEPIASGALYTPWVTRVLRRMEEKWLIEVKTVEGKAAASTAEVLSSKPVLDKLIAKFTASESMPEKLDELLPLMIWKHLLSDAEETQLIRWRDAILKSTAVAVGSERAVAKPKPA